MLNQRKLKKRSTNVRICIESNVIQGQLLDLMSCAAFGSVRARKNRYIDFDKILVKDDENV